MLPDVQLNIDDIKSRAISGGFAALIWMAAQGRMPISFRLPDPNGIERLLQTETPSLQKGVHHESECRCSFNARAVEQRQTRWAKSGILGSKLMMR